MQDTAATILGKRLEGQRKSDVWLTPPGYLELLKTRSEPMSKQMHRANNRSIQKCHKAQSTHKPLVLMEILQTPWPECFPSNRSSEALTARQRKQPGLRTAIITAPFFSHSSFALNVLGSEREEIVTVSFWLAQSFFNCSDAPERHPAELSSGLSLGGNQDEYSIHKRRQAQTGKTRLPKEH